MLVSKHAHRGLLAGLGGALSLLKDRGELNKKVDWVGRTSDLRSDKLALLDDVSPRLVRLTAKAHGAAASSQLRSSFLHAMPGTPPPHDGQLFV